MKKIIILLLFISNLAYGQYKMPEYIVNANPNLPVIYDDQWNGGYKIVLDTTERNDIQIAKRKVGMVVYYNSNPYIFMGADSSNVNWVNNSNWKQVILIDSLNSRVPIASSTGTRYLRDDNTWANLYPTTIASFYDVSKYQKIYCWGNSLTAGAGATPYPMQLRNYKNIITINKGVGGETSTQIKVRFFSDTSTLKYPTIIWAGRNNFTDTLTVLSDIDAMVDSLHHNNYLILSIINGDWTTEYEGSVNYGILTRLNDTLSEIYGNHFVDIRSYLVSKYNSSLPADVIDYNHNVPPQSLRGDSLHLNTLGYSFVVEKIVEKWSILTNSETQPILLAGNVGDITEKIISDSIAVYSLITTGGNVGINKTAPLATLHVVNGTAGGFTPVNDEVAVFQRNAATSSNSVITIIAGALNNASIRFGDAALSYEGAINYSNATNSFSFVTNHIADRFVIDGTGKVGIGMGASVLSSMIDVMTGEGSPLTIYNSTGFPILKTYNSASNGILLQLNDHVGITKIQLDSRNAQLNYINNGGNFSIGNTTSTEKLSVTGNIAVTGTVDTRDISADGSKLDSLNKGGFTDLSFPMNQSRVNPTTSKPDYDYTNGGLLMPDNDTTQIIHLIGQLPHSWYEGTNIRPHIHWIQSSSDSAIFKLKYRIYNIGDPIPAWTIISTTKGEITYVSGSIHQLSNFPAINMTGFTKSCNIDIKLYRSPADNITGDVLVKFFDFHYRVDKFGDLIDYLN